MKGKQIEVLLGLFICSLLALSSCNGSTVCPENSNITDCLNPGTELKECFCKCLETTPSIKDRNLLYITFGMCAQHLKSCQEYNYKIGFIIEVYLTEDLNMPLAISNKWISPTENGLTDFNLADILNGAQLEECKSYKLMIQPQCTVCEFCRNLHDIYITADDTCSQLSTKKNPQPPGTPSPLNNIVFVTTLSVCVITVIGTTVFFIRRQIRCTLFETRTLTTDIDDPQSGENQAITITYHTEI